MIPQEPIKPPLTIPEFAARIKRKHPEYAEVPDEELTDRVLKKHPEYSSRVQTVSRPRNQAQAEADVANARTQFEQARSAYLSASGQKLNPPVDPATAGGYRPLTATERAAQKRGEPVIISEAGSVTPETPPKPQTVTPATVSLDPVIQGRMEQIEREKRQRETRQKVEQARQVMQRRQGLTLPPGQRNQGAAYKPKFGLGQTYREVPKLDKTIPDLTKIAAEPQPTFAEDRAARIATKRQMDRLRGRQGAASDYQGEEYRNFLLVNRSLDSPNMREQFLTLKAKQEIAKHGSIARAVLAEDEERARQQRVAQMGTGEYLSQIPKAAVSGLTGGAGTTLKGLAVVSRKIADQVIDTRGLDTRDTHAYRLGEYITQLGKDNPVFKSNPDLEQEFLVGKAPDTVGQSVIFLLGGWASQSPKLAVTVLGAGMTAGDAYDEVRSLGGSDAEAVNAGLLAGGILGPTELFGMRGAMKAIEGTVAESTLKAALKTAFREGRRDVVENALQEFGQELGQGLITGNPRSLDELVEAGLLGGIGGLQTVPTTLASLALSARTKLPAPQTLIDYALNSPLTTAEDKAKLEKLVESGVSSTEDVQAILSGESSIPSEAESKEVKPESATKQPVSSTAQVEPPLALPEKPKETLQTITETITTPRQASSPDQKPETRTEKPNNLEATVEKPQQIEPDQTAEARTAKQADIIPEIIQPAPAQGPTVTPQAEESPASERQALQMVNTLKWNMGQAKRLSANDAKSVLDHQITFSAWQDAKIEARRNGFPVEETSRVAIDWLSGELGEMPTKGSSSDPYKNKPAVTPTPKPAKLAATESQITTTKEVTDELAEPSVRLAAPKPISYTAPGQATVPDKQVNELQPEVADISVSDETPKHASPSKLTDWGTRLKTIAQSKNLDDLQALSDEMAAHKDDPRVVRLRQSIQEQLARARQPEIPESPETGNKITEEKAEPPALARTVYSPAIEQAFKDWKERRAYIDNNGNYHVKAARQSSGPIAPWNKEAKKLFKNASELHAAAHAEPESGQSSMFARSSDDVTRVIRENRLPKTLYRGENEFTGHRSARQGSGLYMAGDAKYAKKYGELRTFDTRDVVPTNPLVVRSEEDWDGWLVDQFTKAGYRNVRELHKDHPDIRTFVESFGYNGVIISSGKDATIVTYTKEKANETRKSEDLAEEPSSQARGFADGDGGPGIEDLGRGQDRANASRELPRLPKADRFEVEGNRVSLNQQGANLLDEAFRELGRIGTNDPGNIRGAFEKHPASLSSALDNLAKAGRDGAAELAEAVRRASQEGSGKVVLFYGKSARRHELFHEASDKANRLMDERHADLPSLINTDAFRTMSDRLIAIGYPGTNLPVLVEEAAAHIAEGRYEQLGITRDEAVEWMFKWFKSFEQKNPHVTPRQFQEMSDEATQARDKVYATESAVSQPQSDQTLPSVQEGRAQGAGASLARTPDITQTEAFKRWFGESKVVDEDGKPLVVYHGDIRPDPKVLSPDSAVETTGVVFFSDSEDVAHIFRFPREYGEVITSEYDEEADEDVDIEPGASVDSFLRITNPYVLEGSEAQRATDDTAYQGAIIRKAKAEGYDGVIFRNVDEGVGDWTEEGTTYGIFSATQVKSASRNRGTFDPNDPNILMARSDDPWADLMELSDEFGRLANEPELAEGEKPRSLPKTLEAAGLEAGPARGYLPETIDEGVERAKQVITEKGIDGAIEFVRTGDGIEWASTGYEISGQLRAEEANARKEGKTAEADAIRDKRLKFLDDFAMGAVERGRSIVGIKAIAEYAPDRMAYMLNKASLKKRKRGISPEEESRITKLGEELGALADRNKALEKALDAAKAQAKRRAAPAQGKAKKSDYQTRLDEQAQTVLQTLKPKVGHFDLSGLERPSEKGALTIGIPPLPGDAELIAQYAAAKLGKLNSVADLNRHLVQEFGQDLEPHLSKIRQRAYAIRQEARLAEIESEETEPKRRKTILSEIQKEIGDSLRTIREAQKAQDLAQRAERAAEAKSERTAARLEAQQAREQQHEARKQEIKAARVELKRLRQEMKEASKAETKGYRETIKAQKEAARKAELWDTPIRNEAEAARERLKDATDIKEPSVMDDLVSVAAAKFLPEKEGGTPRTGAVEPARVYRDLKDEFPALVTKKNQGEIYKRGYQRIQDATAAAREAARMRSASAEAKRLWDELGVDVDAQAVLIQQAEVRRQTDELRRKAVAEFNRISRSPLGKVWVESNALFRALQSSIDAPLGRQGWFLVLTHPVLAAKYAIPATTRGYTAIHQVDWLHEVENLRKHPDYKLGVDAGLQITETAGASDDPRLQAEEIFSSTLAEKLPHVRLSEQGYVNAMNTLRLSVFSNLAAIGKAEGKTWESDPQFFEQLASFVNDVSGRGTMGHKASIIASFFNGFFYSSRLNVSRFQMLNDLFNPIGYLPEKANLLRDTPGFRSYDPTMRKIAATQTVRLGIALGSIYLLAKLVGFGVEFDPDDPDSFLLRFRNTRWDVTGGEAGTIRFIYRFLHGIEKKATGQDLQPFEEPDELIKRFLRYKLAPIPSGVVDFITGKDAVGNKASLLKYENPKQFAQENIIFKRVTPMLVGTFIDTISMEGWLGIPMALPALTGMNVSSYPDRGLRALKNQTVRDELEDLKITSQSLLGQKTKDDELDKAIESRIMAKVETLDIPTGATDIGKEKLIRERLAQIRLLAKAETALADPERYKHYLSEREAGESLPFLTDDEKKTLTEDDLKAYRQSYAENYLRTLQRVAQTDNYQRADDDKKEKILARVGQAAHTLAKVEMVKTKRKGKP